MQEDSTQTENRSPHQAETFLTPPYGQGTRTGQEIDMPFQVQYTMTLNHVLDFLNFHAAHSPTSRAVRRFWMFAPLGATLIMALQLGIRNHDLVEGIICGLPNLIWLKVGPSLWNRRVRHQAKKLLNEDSNPGISGLQTLSVTSAGLESHNTVSDARINWSGITKIATTDAYAFFYTGTNAAIIIPKSAFPDAADYERFVSLARKYREATAGLNLDAR